MVRWALAFSEVFMSLTLYQMTAPSLIRTLNNLSHLLDKAATQTAAKKVAPETVADSRLIFDMLPLKTQVAIACDMAKLSVSRLTGVEAPKYENTETTIEQLKTRIANTVKYLESVGAEHFKDCETKPIKLEFPQRSFNFDTGVDYVNLWVLPNVYFHVATAYNILRSNGVDIGKADFLGEV
jgi:uncharacterized protein